MFDDPSAITSASAPLALYRRYRPDTFAEVIGQDHVTEPLQRALTNNRVNHAYLFSGPRGCGKTTSARILARALNCEKGPRAVPCGECQSCRDLARNGPGSIDVIEIDAASHGGVDDARDLRERAFFSPVSSRFKIYIVDEAHMVTTAGFNALLKLVEEPPPHVKFVFATTEPDKVISTIRSRTHHYPFRLVPPRLLTEYLAKLCDAEGIAVETAVLPLVVRAGGGSVRDSLSVLDQLLGGAAESGVSYRQAAALLGYTPDSLLDEFVDAFAAGDAGGVFACVDKVIEVGQDPRRFAEDLLRRLRDLVIVAAVPDALTSGLVDVAADQAERLSSQAASLGAGELTRAAEVIATGLTDMRGTTAPRLHLELMCARVLLPGADADDRGVHARLDRLERRIGIAEVTSPVRSEPPTPRSEPVDVRSEPVEGPSVEQASTSSAGRSPHPEPVDVQPEPAEVRPERVEGRAEGPSTSAVLSSSKGAVLSSSKGSAPISPQLTVTDVRRLWPEVLEEVKGKRRFTWILLSQNAQVAELRNDTLLLAMSNAGARDSFARGGSEDVLREAMVVVMGADFAVETMVDPGAAASAGAPRTPPADEQPHDPTRPKPDSSRTRAANGVRMDPPEDPDAVASRDDSDLEEDAESHAELLARHLGAEIIAEEDHGA
ncbi:MAG TPA: DNA polymerase III subunit gamma and tau [Propionibacteriaceae bacterium]|nr:DNA polymerase III subunit gamma and tau [Propionibacteriaceae bacterium]